MAMRCDAREGEKQWKRVCVCCVCVCEKRAIGDKVVMSWEVESDMAAEPRGGSPIDPIPKRRISGPEPEASLQRMVNGIEGVSRFRLMYSVHYICDSTARLSCASFSLPQVSPWKVPNRARVRDDQRRR